MNRGFLVPKPSLISRTVSVDVKHHVYLLAYVPNKSTVSVDVKQHFNLMSALDKRVSRTEALQSLVVTTCDLTCFGLAACTQRDQQHGIYAGTCDVVFIVQELCESRGGRPGLSVLTSLLVSVDVKIYCTVLRHWSQLVPNMSHDI